MLTATWYERVTRGLLTVWVCGAIIALCVFGVPGLAWMRIAVPVTWALSALLTRWTPRVVAVPAAMLMVYPAAFLLLTGAYQPANGVWWVAAMAGVTLPGSLTRAWALPTRWRAVLVGWALVAAVGSSIVALREVDFHLDLLLRQRLPGEVFNAVPSMDAAWSLYVGLLVVVGIFWLDWLCRHPLPFLLRWVALPMAVGAVAMAAVACWQMFIDITALNPTVFAGLRRAAGTMLDGNEMGALAACWIGGSLALSRVLQGRLGTLAVASAVLMWLAVWASGSRTALVAGALISVVSATAFIDPQHMTWRARLTAVLVLLLAAGTFGVAMRKTARVVGPMQRLMETLPEPNAPSIVAFAREMVNRNEYGAVSQRFIAERLWFGIGLGSFYGMVSLVDAKLPADNAQNWYRHQLTELGVVGACLPWVWSLILGAWLLRRSALPRWAVPVRAVLVAVAAISLVGVPGQGLAMSMTIWMACAMFMHAGGALQEPERSRPATWAAVWALALVFGIGTVVSAATLRPPVRMQRAGWDYAYGVWPDEVDADGSTFRWTRRAAVVVVPLEGPILRVTLSVNFPDPAAYPVHVRARVDGRSLLDAVLTADAPSVTGDVHVGSQVGSVLLETNADRTTQTPPPDGRELGAIVRWRFLDH